MMQTARTQTNQRTPTYLYTKKLAMQNKTAQKEKRTIKSKWVIGKIEIGIVMSEKVCNFTYGYE
jgi:hypothetical protein